jgi:NADH:ubiquinone oxidoreductase subunit E
MNLKSKGIKSGEVNPDGKFSLKVSLSWSLRLAPVVMINDKVYGKVR